MNTRALCGGLAAAICLSLAPSVTAQEGSGPKVVHTGIGPTGYEVTFRFFAPEATSVKIRGEWFFARPSELVEYAATPDIPVIEGQGLMPTAWQPGDFPLVSPNSTSPNWPVTDMKKSQDGVWTFTTPLPSGVFTYGFFVDCLTEDTTECTQVSDPENRPWNELDSSFKAVRAANSQVYVPSDPAFGTVDYSWLAPAKAQGTLSFATYSSPGHVTPESENYLVIYTPPNYDPSRAKAYPTLYLSHGGGENEMGWSTQGVVQPILDNLIGTGQIEPLVVVMPNGSGYPDSDFNEAYDQDLVTNVVPYIEKNFNVSPEPSRRAFSGLSMGGMLTNSFLTKHPEVFDYYGIMSAGLPPAYSVLTPEQADALHGKTVFVGGGWQDSIHAEGFGERHNGPAREISTLVAAGVPVMPNFVPGGHQWFVWRVLLKDFLTKAAFLPPPYAHWQQ